MKIILKKLVILGFLIIISLSSKCESKNITENIRDSAETKMTVNNYKEINAMKVNAREQPNAGSPVMFTLYKGMKYSPVMEKVTGKTKWEKIKIDKKNYWLEIESTMVIQEAEAQEYKFSYRIEVRKSERILMLKKKSADKWVNYREYDIGIGRTGDIRPKKHRGDCRTPSGKYFICNINPSSSYGEDPENGNPLPSLMIGYPNRQDGWNALQTGKIDIKTYNLICEAIDAGKTPPQDTPLGNYLMVHGGGSNEDWTLGCIALDDEDMKELAGYAKIGMMIEILP